jgi:lipopolysaccharide export system ATP-binding protein
LSVGDLRLRLGGRWVVDGVSLVVAPGEIVGLLGPNGAGKTVTFYMISGLLRPSSGTVTLDSVDITHLPMHARARLGIGYLPQERSVFRGLSAEENIAAVLECHGTRPRAARIRARELLERFHLSHVAGLPARRLSGGEQRRLEVARAMATEPRFLLFDEPFAGIDPLTIETLHTLIVAVRNAGTGVLLTDHNVTEALSLCDRAYILFSGKVLAEGTRRELMVNAAVKEHFLGEAFDADLLTHASA